MDFKEKNKIKIEEITTEAQGDYEVIEKKTETYNFITGEDVMSFKNWAYHDLWDEDHRLVSEEENAEWNDKKAEWLEKKNGKFSKKDRNKSMKKCKKIRKEKMGSLSFKALMTKLTDNKKQLELSKKFLDLQTEAREEYIKATMTDNSNYKLDLAMNRMRKQYRLTRLYLSLQRDEKDKKQLSKLEAGYKEARAKLENEIKEAKKLPGFDKRFKWERVTGRKELSEETREKNRIIEEQHREEVRQERERKRIERLERIERTKAMIDSGEWTKTEQGKQTVVKIDEEWHLSEYKEELVKVFTDENNKLMEMHDSIIAGELFTLNKNVKSNLNYIRQHAANGLTGSYASKKGKQNREIAEYVGKGFGWINRLCVDKYTEKLKKAMIADPEIAKNYIAKNPPELSEEELKSIEEGARRWKEIRDLDFKEMGIDIYNSEFIKILLTDKNIKIDDLKGLKRQTEGVARLLKRMVRDKFGYLNDEEIYKGLRKFIGDKALLVSNRKLTDLAERYLLGLSYTDRTTALIQKDYEDSYAENVTAPFAGMFKVSVEKYLGHTKKDWGENRKSRRGEFDNRLKLINKVFTVLTEKSSGVMMSKDGWNDAFAQVKKLITGTLWKYSAFLTAEDEKALNRIILKIVKDSETKDKGQEKISFESFTETEQKEKKKEEEKTENVSEYSFAHMLREAFDSELFKEIIADDTLRAFLADNMSVFLFRNPKLIEKYPFMKDIKGIDELEELTFDQFEAVTQYLYDSLSKDGVGESIKKMLEGTETETETYKRVLLKVLSDKTDGEGVNALLKEELDKKERQKKLNRQKLLITIGTNKGKRDGKIHYRYEDLRDRDKSILQTYFGKNSDWLQKRIRKFDRAESVWKRIEQLGPEQTAFVKGIFASAYREENPGKTLKLIAECFSKDDIKANLEKYVTLDDIYTGNDLRGDLEVIAAAFKMSDQSAEKELLEIANKSKIEKNTAPEKGKAAKPMGIGEFIIEMSLCGTQDILLGHKGKFQKVLFMYEDMDNYDSELMKVAKFAIGRLDVLDKALEGYDPKVRTELRNKLTRTCLELESEKYEQKLKFDEQLTAQTMALDANQSFTKTARDAVNNEVLRYNEIGVKLEDLRSELKSAENDRDISASTRERCVKESGENKKALKEALNAKNDAEKKRDSAQKTSAKMTEEFTKKYGKKGFEAKGYADAQTKLSKAVTLYMDAEAALKSAEEEYERLLKRSSSLTSQINNLAEKTDGLNKHIKGLKDEIKKNNDELQTIYAAIQDKRTKVVKNNDKIQSIEHETSKLDVNTVREEYLKENAENIKKYGIDNLKELGGLIELTVEKDGVMKDELRETLELYEERKKKLEEYKDGKLAGISDILMDNSEILSYLLDPADSVAEAKIDELYDFFAPFAEAVENQASPFLGEYYLEDNLDMLLSKKGKVYHGIVGSLKDKDHKEKVDFWRNELLEFGDRYFTQQKKGSKSILENLEVSGGDLLKKLTIYYQDSGKTKDEKKLQKAQFRKYWFIDSKNYGVELAAQKGGQSNFQIATHKAQAMLKQINAYITTDEYCIQQACIKGTLTDLYSEYSDNYIANDEYMESYFVQYVLENQYGDKRISRAMLTDNYTTGEKKLLESLNDRSVDELKDIKIRLEDFRNYIKDAAFKEKPEEFAKNIGKYVKDYLGKVEKAIKEDSSLTKENREAYLTRIESERKAREKVLTVKSEGRNLYDRELFGGRLQELKEFGEQKQSLIYITGSGRKNKSIRSAGAGEDKELLEKAKEYFKDEEIDVVKYVYPDFLAECLDEYMRQNQKWTEKADRAADWVLRFDNIFKAEAQRLKSIYRFRKSVSEGESDSDLEAFVVYAARHSESRPEGDVPAGIPAGEELRKLGKKFNMLMNPIKELEQIELTDKALILAHRDACEKTRALIYYHRDIAPKDLNLQVAKQIKYFVFADKAYRVMKDEVDKHPYLSGLGDVYKNRYLNGLREYFTRDIIKDSLADKALDEGELRRRIGRRVVDGCAREALIARNAGSVSNLDLEPENIYPGAMSVKDFEHVLVATRKKEIIKSYNELGATQRKLFAISLYSSKLEQHGTQKVVYGISDTGLRDTRAQIMRYMKGEDVNFEVDYARSIRAVSTKNKNFKISGDTKLFEEALEFVKKVDMRREQLRPKDYARMSDSLTVIKEAELFRGEAQAGATNVVSQKKEYEKQSVTSAKKFENLLSDYAMEDRERIQSQGLIGRNVDKADRMVEGYDPQTVMKRVNKLSNAQKSLMMFVLRDRTVLDFSSAGKNKEDGIVPHVNAEKRFKLFEQLVDEKGRYEALKEAGNAENIEQAFASALSFQLRDDRQLTEGKLTKDDFVSDSIGRVTVVDWKLIEYAVDFIEEVERERRRLFVVRQAKNILENEKSERTPALKFYHQHKSMVESGNTADAMQSFENTLDIAYKEDTLYNDKSIKDEADDLMGAYYGLNMREKALFIRALENRDILDVSQKNLYKNFIGLADRNFVNEKDRDSLADEFIENNCSVELKGNAYREAFKSLFSTQINDDMSFEKIKGINWADKNLNVDNQFFVTKRKSAVDWKLFKRALQFVKRTVNERKQTVGNEEIYEALGDKQANGELKIDTKYLRMNLHNTGSRFMRFLAKEGYAQIEDDLSVFEKVGDYAGYVLSTKTNNFIKGELNTFISKKEEEAEAKEEEKEENEENQEEEEKKPLGFMEVLKGLADNFTEQKATLDEMFESAKQMYEDTRELMSDEEKEVERTDELQEELKDIKLPEVVDNSITGYKYVDLVINGGIKAAAIKSKIDEVAQDTETLEKIDKYIEDYLGGFMSTKKLGDWYSEKMGLKDKEDDKEDDKKDENAKEAEDKEKLGFIDSHIPEGLRKELVGYLEAAEKSGEMLKWVKESVFDPGMEMLSDMKDMYESYRNISKLSESREKAKEKHDEDSEKINGAGLSEEKRKAVEKARQNNLDLLKGSSDMTKNIESRKILLKTGDLAQKILSAVGEGEFNSFIDKAFKFAGFIWHCMSDRKAVTAYYSASGKEDLEKILDGKDRFKQKFRYDNDVKIKNERNLAPDGNLIVGSKEMETLTNGMGFEEEEELVKFLRLNMVNALLFSASKFNPLKEPKILAECTLTVLGLEKAVGKTDNETAMNVFNKLSA
ncbi:MAG: hypothetical protein IJ796_04480 [Lachnospiraceae bacterium]|nr:hypothetical protein [Lachnospiraceae bacterium]